MPVKRMDGPTLTDGQVDAWKDRKEGDGWMDWWVGALKENKIHGRVHAMRSQARQSYEGTGRTGRCMDRQTG